MTHPASRLPRLPAGASSSQTPPAPNSPLMRDVAYLARSLRDCASSLGGMIEHYVECDCGLPTTEHDAVVLVIPHPYIDEYRRHLPDLLSKLGITQETPQ